VVGASRDTKNLWVWNGLEVPELRDHRIETDILVNNGLSQKFRVSHVAKYRKATNILIAE